MGVSLALWVPGFICANNTLWPEVYRSSFGKDCTTIVVFLVFLFSFFIQLYPGYNQISPFLSLHPTFSAPRTRRITLTYIQRCCPTPVFPTQTVVADGFAREWQRRRLQLTLITQILPFMPRLPMHILLHNPSRLPLIGQTRFTPQ